MFFMKAVASAQNRPAVAVPAGPAADDPDAAGAAPAPHPHSARHAPAASA